MVCSREASQVGRKEDEPRRCRRKGVAGRQRRWPHLWAVANRKPEAKPAVARARRELVATGLPQRTVSREGSLADFTKSNRFHQRFNRRHHCLVNFLRQPEYCNHPYAEKWLGAQDRDKPDNPLLAANIKVFRSLQATVHTAWHWHTGKEVKRLETYYDIGAPGSATEWKSKPKEGKEVKPKAVGPQKGKGTKKRAWKEMKPKAVGRKKG